MEDPSGKMFWDTLLVLAEASLRQAVANEGASNAIKLLTQRLLCKESDAALVPGWLDARYGDAEAITSLAGQVAQQAGCNWQGIVGGREDQPNNSPLVDKQVAKQVMGTKRRVPSVLDMLVREPLGGAGTDVATSLAADTTGVVVGDGLVGNVHECCSARLWR